MVTPTCAHVNYAILFANHVTLNESDASESITWLYFKLHNAHFSVHYLDSAHFGKANSCFGWVTLGTLYTNFVCITG